MKLIVGLGNPEVRYMRNRHNAGRLGVVCLADLRQAGFRRDRILKATLAQFQHDGETMVAAYPDTYMNLSGDAVVRLVRQFDIEPVSGLLVIVDDLALPFGSLRLRPDGGTGGHNGLKSIDAALSSSEYARLRIGVGHPSDLQGDDESRPEVSEYLLSDFSRDEEKALPGILRRAAEAALLWAGQPIERAMNAVNASQE